jgi:hypothetical protein
MRIGFHHLLGELTRPRCTPAITQSEIPNGPEVITIGLPSDSTPGNALVSGTGPRFPFTSQGIDEQSAEAGAGTGDENRLLGIHDLCLVLALMFQRHQQMDFRRKTTGCS